MPNIEKQAEDNGNGLILIVDDVEMIRKLASKMLPRLGYQAMLAESAGDGLNVYRQYWQDIDLVIMDMILPDKNGIECLQDMQEINPEIRAVLASGYNEETITADMKMDCIVDFLHKPFRLQDLAATLARVFCEGSNSPESSQ